MLTPKTGRLAKLMLGVLAFSSLGAAFAQAQYYQERGYDRPPPGYYRERPQREYYRERGYDRPAPGYYRERRASRMGHVCYTSRGACEQGQYFPAGTVCKCHIPGFGPKRGVIR